MKHIILVMLLTLSFAVRCSAQQEETTLFDAGGNAVAYIALESDEPTIFMWSGKPVAYLASSSGDGFSIYGFNGKHLGWFVKGVVRDHDGNGACGVRGVVQSPKVEPFKAFKEFTPFKAFKEFEPFRPAFKLVWSSTPCGIFLFEGAK